MGSYSRRRLGTIVAAPTISAPVLSNPTSGGEWDTQIDASYVGFTRHLRTFTNSGLTAEEQHLYKPVAVNELATGSSSWLSTAEPPPRDFATGNISALNFGQGNRWWYEYIERDDGVVSPNSNTINATLVDPNASTQWRLRVTGTQNGNAVSLAEIKCYGRVGDLTSLVAPSSAAADSVASWDTTLTAAKTIDGDPATIWFSGDGFPHTLTLTFAAAFAARQFSIQAAPSGGNSGWAPKNFTWQRWDGAAFVDYLSPPASDLWSDGETRTFHI